MTKTSQFFSLRLCSPLLFLPRHLTHPGRPQMAFWLRFDAALIVATVINPRRMPILFQYRIFQLCTGLALAYELIEVVRECDIKEPASWRWRSICMVK